ncbi:MAG: hypothetical protein H6510_16140 [Acidobacteria bacterium]|nr:hypothetical protein [Acidobacteriota bacterium]MCB9399343.1 hypothetical protein [Acidobacteriota bacterium]
MTQKSIASAFLLITCLSVYGQAQKTSWKDPSIIKPFEPQSYSQQTIPQPGQFHLLAGSGRYWFFENSKENRVCYLDLEKKAIRDLPIQITLPNYKSVCYAAGGKRMVYYDTTTDDFVVFDLASGKEEQRFLSPFIGVVKNVSMGWANDAEIWVVCQESDKFNTYRLSLQKKDPIFVKKYHSLEKYVAANDSGYLQKTQPGFFPPYGEEPEYYAFNDLKKEWRPFSVSHFTGDLSGQWVFLYLEFNPEKSFYLVDRASGTPAIQFKFSPRLPLYWQDAYFVPEYNCLVDIRNDIRITTFSPEIISSLQKKSVFWCSPHTVKAQPNQPFSITISKKPIWPGAELKVIQGPSGLKFQNQAVEGIAPKQPGFHRILVQGKTPQGFLHYGFFGLYVE